MGTLQKCPVLKIQHPQRSFPVKKPEAQAIRKLLLLGNTITLPKNSILWLWSDKWFLNPTKKATWTHSLMSSFPSSGSIANILYSVSDSVGSSVCLPTRKFNLMQPILSYFISLLNSCQFITSYSFRLTGAVTAPRCCGVDKGHLPS